MDDQIVYAQPVPPPHCSQETQSHSLKPTQVPTVGTTLPSEGISTQRQHASRSPEVNPPSGEKSRPSALTRPVRRGQEPQERAIAPRRFHLAKNSLKVPSPYAVSKASAQRHAKPMKNELAVFVEAGKAFKDKSRPRINAGNGERRNELGDNIRRKIEGSETPRKRPNATAVERKWRAENWKERREPQASTEQHERSACNVSQPSHEWDYESPELAAQLQKIAFQETKAPEEHLEGHQDGQYLKIKPKPPKPRQPALDIRTNEEDESRDEVMADANSVDDDTDYVFDTYIRSVAQPCSIIDAGDPFLNSLHGTNPSDMGLLIIEDGEEEELWETFGEDKDSDPERNSEEEDENGMSIDFSSVCNTDSATSGGFLWQRLPRRRG